MALGWSSGDKPERFSRDPTMSDIFFFLFFIFFSCFTSIYNPLGYDRPYIPLRMYIMQVSQVSKYTIFLFQLSMCLRASGMSRALVLIGVVGKAKRKNGMYHQSCLCLPVDSQISAKIRDSIPEISAPPFLINNHDARSRRRDSRCSSRGTIKTGKTAPGTAPR